MATTVAHGLIGIATYCAFAAFLPAQRPLPIGVKPLLLAALVANIPDLDMLVGLLSYGDHTQLHGGITHSFAFAGMLALLVGLWGRGGMSINLAIASFLLVSSHVVVDWFTGPQWGINPSHGLAPLWPFMDGQLRMPLTLFKGVDHGDLFPGAVYTALWELLLLGPLTFIFIIIRINIHKKSLSTEDRNGMAKTYR